VGCRRLCYVRCWRVDLTTSSTICVSDRSRASDTQTGQLQLLEWHAVELQRCDSTGPASSGFDRICTCTSPHVHNRAGAFLAGRTRCLREHLVRLHAQPRIQMAKQADMDEERRCSGQTNHSPSLNSHAQSSIAALLLLSTRAGTSIEECMSRPTANREICANDDMNRSR
jgi:hypothetical protein